MSAWAKKMKERLSSLTVEVEEAIDQAVRDLEVTDFSERRIKKEINRAIRVAVKRANRPERLSSRERKEHQAKSRGR